MAEPLPYTNTTIDVYRQDENIPAELQGEGLYAQVVGGVPAYVSYDTGTETTAPGEHDHAQTVRIMAELTDIEADDQVQDTVTKRWYKVTSVLNRSNSEYPRTSVAAFEIDGPEAV